ncbi:MAG: NfeD family protein [Methanoregula sp.]|nr:NfeD family protein [Methanoregula sp.]
MVLVLEPGTSMGWILIIIGALLLLFEVHSPGFFAAVPGTVMIILGILLLLGIDIFSSGWGIVIGVIIALCSAGFTVWMYGKITPDRTPTTISRDTLVGMSGLVKTQVDSHSIAGKVMIGSTEWSARSTGSVISAGERVKVVDSQGVHIVVEVVE